MPKILDIIKHPDPRLRQVSLETEPGTIKDPKMQSFLQDMVLTMQKKDGVGLAAPQVAANIRVIVIYHKERIYIMVNPLISKWSWAKKTAEEGCLSVPNTFGNVMRYKRLSCEYLDEKGQKQKLEASDMLARIIQHELDHLDGVLFIDKAKNIHKV